MIEIDPGMKIAAQINPEASAEELQWLRQMGLEYVVLWTNAEKASAAYYADRKAYFQNHGLKVYGFGNSDVHNQDAIVLNLENRDAKIEEYKSHLRNLGKAGIPYTTYAHMANGIWSTEREFTRGGAPAHHRHGQDRQPGLGGVMGDATVIGEGGQVQQLAGAGGAIGRRPPDGSTGPSSR